MRDGSRGRISKDMHEAESEDLHVYIAGEDQAGVDSAKNMVNELLKPLDDELNQHKQNQLRQLALINGTLRDEEFCPVCGEKGHRQFECPHRAVNTVTAGVKCGICGDLSHPTRDCPFKTQSTTVDAGVIDSAYSDCMAELEGRELPPAATTNTAAAKTAAPTTHAHSHAHAHAHSNSNAWGSGHRESKSDTRGFGLGGSAAMYGAGTPTAAALYGGTTATGRASPTVAAYGGSNAIYGGGSMVPPAGDVMQNAGFSDYGQAYGAGASAPAPALAPTAAGYGPPTHQQPQSDYNQDQWWLQPSYSNQQQHQQTYQQTYQQPYQQSYQQTYQQTYQQDPQQSEYDAQWAEYFAANPAAYAQYVAEQQALMATAAESAAAVPPPPPPP